MQNYNIFLDAINRFIKLNMKYWLSVFLIFVTSTFCSTFKYTFDFINGPPK